MAESSADSLERSRWAAVYRSSSRLEDFIEFGVVVLSRLGDLKMLCWCSYAAIFCFSMRAYC